MRRAPFHGVASATLDGSQSAFGGPIKKVVGAAEGHHVHALKGALADAQKQMAAKGS